MQQIINKAKNIIFIINENKKDEVITILKNKGIYLDKIKDNNYKICSVSLNISLDHLFDLIELFDEYKIFKNKNSVNIQVEL